MGGKPDEPHTSKNALCTSVCVCVYIIILAHGYILKILNERIKYFTTRIGEGLLLLPECSVGKDLPAYGR